MAGSWSKPQSLGLTVCWLWPRPFDACEKRGRASAKEVGGGGRTRRDRAPQSIPAVVATELPVWEAFPELNRVVVLRLLGVLVERMTAGRRTLPGRDRSEQGAHARGAAVGAAGAQGGVVAS